MISDTTLPGIEISEADGGVDMVEVRKLLREFQVWFDVDFCFQGFEAELADLPGCYAAPRGLVMLARDATGERVAGGVGVRPLDGDVCELKRLFVRPPWRGLGLGRRLTELTLRFAADAGYRRMRLDTLPKLTEAIRLYRTMGFEEIPAYYDNPLDGVVYMQRPIAGP